MIIKKKHKGSSTLNMIASILVILTVTIIMLAFLYTCQVVSYKENIKQIARGYLLEMETIGYLTPESRTALLQELIDNDLTNIDLSGTTMTAVGYGNDIVLSVQGALPVKTLNTSSGDMLSFFFADSAWDISIYLQSTAKY